jgi:acyl dehydratase
MAARTVVPDIASLGSLVGKELEASGWIEISQEKIDAFAALTGDDQWIHTDPDRARRESPFGGTIAHGHLTLSLAAPLLRDILEVEGARFLVNPGIERVPRCTWCSRSRAGSAPPPSAMSWWSSTPEPVRPAG